MSSKKRALKSSNPSIAVADEKTEEETAVLLAPDNATFSLVHSRHRFQGLSCRPALSRLVNVSCLRPHGEVRAGEFNAAPESAAPGVELLEEIAVSVNAPRRLLHHRERFTCLGDPHASVSMLHGASFRRWCLDDVAQRGGSAAGYPFTSFHFFAPDCAEAASLSSSSHRTAETIRRILVSFAWAADHSWGPWRELLFHVFHTERTSGEGLLVANYSSRHITVCCGLYYYKVDVLDRDGAVLSTSAIADSLHAVRLHAAAAEQSLREQPILPEAREDLIAFYKFLGRLTLLERGVSAAAMERLRRASAVTASALDTLDAGIFCVALQSASTAWCRCALQLEEVDPPAGRMTLRAHTAAVSRDDLLALVERLALPPPPAADAVSGGMAPLEMWLPWKHRSPLRPYAAPLAKAAARDPTAGRPVAWAVLCLAAALAAPVVLCPAERVMPAVVVARPYGGGGVAVALLQAEEITALAQACRGGSALVGRWAQRELAEKALRRVAEIVDQCQGEEAPLYTMARLLLDQGAAKLNDKDRDAPFGPIDLCITAAPLGTGGHVYACEEDLVLPSSHFALSCGYVGTAHPTPQQPEVPPPKATPKTIGPSTAHVLCAALRAVGNEVEEVTCTQLAERIKMECESLEELLSM